MQNQKIKDLMQMRKAKNRQEKRLFIVEGLRENARALAAQFRLNEFYLCREVAGSDGERILARVDSKIITEVTASVFGKIAVRENSGGVIGVFEDIRDRSTLPKPSSEGVFIGLENIEKPGNLGAILRSADAFGIEGIFLLDECTDIYNQNVIRASLGAVFDVPVYGTTNSKAQTWVAEHEVTLLVAHRSKKAEPLATANNEYPALVILGAEARGVSESWLSQSKLVAIPQTGRSDSLNLSVAAAVIMYALTKEC